MSLARSMASARAPGADRLGRLLGDHAGAGLGGGERHLHLHVAAHRRLVGEDRAHGRRAEGVAEDRRIEGGGRHGAPWALTRRSQNDPDLSIVWRWRNRREIWRDRGKRQGRNAERASLPGGCERLAAARRRRPAARSSARARRRGVAAEERAARFPTLSVYLRDIDPSILQDIRYAGPDNFTGRPRAGLRRGRVRAAARGGGGAVAGAAGLAGRAELSLKVYDCYRPRRAVRAFVAWVKERQRRARPAAQALPSQPRAQPAHHLGYIADVSRHSRGDTVDLTLVAAARQARRALRPQGRLRRLHRAGQGSRPRQQRRHGHRLRLLRSAEPHRRGRPSRPRRQRWRQTLVEAMAQRGLPATTEGMVALHASGTAPAPRAFDVPIVAAPAVSHEARGARKGRALSHPPLAMAKLRAQYSRFSATTFQRPPSTLARNVALEPWCRLGPKLRVGPGKIGW